ncbi:hypothetical protein [Fodinicola feengrottensis]|uniref:Uncharacterized protein n=1 Tax=Fodinicola feengrottensis TaxID=435914 RepID=A0ABP4SGU5_9ACTN|nr:hypothetical protein [Fodinicola feengrottensis]
MAHEFTRGPQDGPTTPDSGEVTGSATDRSRGGTDKNATTLPPPETSRAVEDEEIGVAAAPVAEYEAKDEQGDFSTRVAQHVEKLQGIGKDGIDHLQQWKATEAKVEIPTGHDATSPASPPVSGAETLLVDGAFVLASVTKAIKNRLEKDPD